LRPVSKGIFRLTPNLPPVISFSRFPSSTNYAGSTTSTAMSKSLEEDREFIRVKHYNNRD